MLKKGSHIIGRSKRCDFVVSHPSVSRQHAEISVKISEITVRDLASRNGTFIDNVRIAASAIKVGQVLRLGTAAFEVQSLLDEDGPSSEIETSKSSLAELDSHADLSQAQRRVLALLRGALTEKEIAARLELRPTTVHKHIQAIYRAFNVHTRLELLVALDRRRKPD